MCIRDRLSAVFRTPVQFACDKNGKGRITFPFANDDELVRLITMFDSLKLNQEANGN